MPKYELYKLALGVQLFEVAGISDFDKRRFEYDDSDVVLSMPDSRTTSKLINRTAADFLENIQNAAFMGRSNCEICKCC